MNKKFEIRDFLTSGLTILVCLLLLSCKPTELPFVKEKIIEMDKERTRQIEEMVKNSVELRDLDKICRDLPFVKEMKVVTKSASNSRKSLYYYYFSEENMEDLKKVDKEYLIQNGWTKLREYDDSEAYKIEFKKGKYFIEINYGSYENNPSNYVTNCDEKVSD